MRYIERDLPIEALNEVATAETGLGMRHPIYMIHKWVGQVTGQCLPQAPGLGLGSKKRGR
jgi:hypothetical protein